MESSWLRVHGQRPCPISAPDGGNIIASDEALEIRKIPRELLIVGGGYIGVEFATLFSTLGSRVTIVEVLENILTGIEGELVRNLRRVFEKDGVKVYTQSSIEEIHPRGEGLGVVLKTPQGTEEVSADTLLLSVGRAPNLDLSLSEAGVEISPSGIRVNRRMETTVLPIYAIGDAIGGPLWRTLPQRRGSSLQRT